MTPPVTIVHAGKSLDRLEQILRGEGARERDTPASLYRKVSYLRECVDLRGKSAAGVPFDLCEGERVIATESDALPRPIENLLDLRRQMVGSLALSGQAFAVTMMKSRRGVQEVRYMAPHTMEPLYAAGQIYGFRRSPDGRRRQEASGTIFSPDVVAFAETPAVYTEEDHRHGAGEAVLQAASALHSIETFIANHVGSGLVKTTILGVPEGTSPESRTTIRDWFSRLVSGRKNAGRAEVFNADRIQPHTIGDGLKDLEAEALTRSLVSSIAAGMGVPLSLISSEAANYATARQDWVRFYQSTVLPDLRLVDAALHRAALRRLGYTLKLRPDRLEVFQQSELEKAEKVAVLVGRPVLSLEEGRALLGYSSATGEAEDARNELEEQEASPTQPAEKSWTDGLWLWENWVRVHGRDVKPPIKGIPPDVRGRIRLRLDLGDTVEHAFHLPGLPHATKAHDPTDPGGLYQRTEAARAPLYDKAEELAARTLAAITSAVAARAEEGINALSAIDGSQTRALIEGVFDLAGTFYYETLGSLGAAGRSTDAIPDLWAERARARIAEVGGAKIRDIDATTRQILQPVLEEAISEGVGTDEIARRLRKANSEWSRVRSAAIARTEVVSASNYATVAAAEDYEAYTGGTVEKEWLATSDGRERATHLAASGQRVGINETFTVGGYPMDHPGDSSHGAPAEEVVNCRCTVLLIVT